MTSRAPIEVDAVLLDLDDTLIREHDFVLSGYAAVAEALAPILDTAPQDLRERLGGIYDGPHRHRAFDELLEGFDRLDLVPSCIQTYRTHTPTISLTRDAEDVLAALSGHVAMGVVTDGPLVMQEAKVGALGLRERGIEVVCTDALGGRDSWKPSPVGIVEALRRLDVEPARSVYIGDNPHKDFLAAARAGAHSIRVRRHGQLHAACECADGTPEPSAEVTDLRDAVDLLALEIG